MIISFSLLVNSSIYNLLIYGNVNFKIICIKKRHNEHISKLSCVREFTLCSYIYKRFKAEKNEKYYTEEMHQTEKKMPINNVDR